MFGLVKRKIMVLVKMPSSLGLEDLCPLLLLWRAVLSSSQELDEKIDTTVILSVSQLQSYCQAHKALRKPTN